MKNKLKQLLFILVGSVGLANFSVPAVAFADVQPVFEISSAEVRELELVFDALRNEWRKYGEFPKSEMAEPRHSIELPITAYSSEPWQTDSTPFITASNTHVRDGIVATNFLPIGTRVRIPGLYGDKIFIVEDRMNRRYTYHMDIWMSETPDAINFGLQFATVEIF